MTDTVMKYRPSNNTEGTIFYDNHCARCKRDRAYRENEDGEEGCPILARSMAYDIDDAEYPDEWQYGEDGRPCCTAFEDEEPVDTNQMDLPSVIAKQIVHCWAEGPPLADGCPTTCMLEDGHDGPHQWWRDDEITVSFPAIPLRDPPL